jgi:hypothetical protein
MKRLLIGTLLASVLFFTVTPTPKASADTLSQDQLALVTNNCVSAQGALQNLERRDTVLRINLGTLYDAALNQSDAFVSRLAHNGINNSTIKQTDQAMHNGENQFENDYDDYATVLEQALSTNCMGDPQHFYDLLTQAETDRQSTGNDVTSLNDLISQYISEIDAIHLNQGGTTK